MRKNETDKCQKLVCNLYDKQNMSYTWKLLKQALGDGLMQGNERTTKDKFQEGFWEGILQVDE